MIARLSGVLVQKQPEEVLLDVNGVGYEVRVPLSTFVALPDDGKTVSLRIHTHVREDVFQLFGFESDAERACFRMLLGISGVGPRVALAILSGLPAEQLREAIRAGDLARLVAIPGVGKKTAERILVDLRDRISKLATGPEEVGAPVGATAIEDSALSALTNLGYTRPQAERAVRAALDALPVGADLPSVIKEALRVAAG